jgi:hypothetical protein
MGRISARRLTGGAAAVAVVAITVALLTQPAKAADKRPTSLAGLTAQMVLVGSPTLPAGFSLGGTLIVDNTTKGPISVDQGCSGQPEFRVVLTSSAVPQSAGFNLPGCPPVVLSPGIHRYPFILNSTYQECTEAGGSGSSSTDPPCLQPGNHAPPLPIGRYQATMATMSPIPVAKPIAVKVIKPRSNPSAFHNPPTATERTVPGLRSLQRGARVDAIRNGDSAVHHGFIVLTSREQAAAHDVVNSDRPVYEVVLQGRFVCGVCSSPPGAPAPTGTVIRSVLDQETLRGTDFSISRSLPAVLVGNRVYRFNF